MSRLAAPAAGVALICTLGLTAVTAEAAISPAGVTTLSSSAPVAAPTTEASFAKDNVAATTPSLKTAASSAVCDDFGYQPYCNLGKGTQVTHVRVSGRFAVITFRNIGASAKRYVFKLGRHSAAKRVRGHHLARLRVPAPMGNSTSSLRIVRPDYDTSAGVFRIHRGTGQRIVTRRHFPTLSNGIARECVRNVLTHTAVLNMGIDNGNGYVFRVFRTIKPGRVGCVQRALPYYHQTRGLLFVLANSHRTKRVEAWVARRG